VKFGFQVDYDVRIDIHRLGAISWSLR
jgi:hypothetical protein